MNDGSQESGQGVELDEHTQAMIQKINSESDYDTAVQLMRDLDSYLFKGYCAKPDLDQADPEYCSFAAAGACGYLNHLKAVYELSGINLVRRHRS